MLSERSRNIIVGLTIIVALGVAIAGIGALGRLPSIHSAPYEVTLEAPNANGIQPAARVDLNGVTIGSVKSIRLVTVTRPAASTRPDSVVAPATAPATGPMVPTAIAELILRINRDIDIPASAVATIKSQSIGIGAPSVSINVTNVAGPMLPKDNSARITAAQVDSGLFPKEIFADIHVLKEDLSLLSRELTTVARDLHTMLAYTPLERLNQFPPGDPRRPPENISTLVLKLNKTVDEVNALLTDPQIQGQIRQIAKNIADASAQLRDTMKALDSAIDSADKTIVKVGTAADNISSAATRASVTLDTTREQIVKVSERLVTTLAALEKTTTAISSGKGTTGKLVNDPRLYDGLVDLTNSLKTTVEDLSKLVRQWKEEGVPLKLK